VKEGLLLDRVYRFGADLPVCPGIQDPFFIESDPADSVLSLFDSTSLVAERARYRIIFEFFVLASLMHTVLSFFCMGTDGLFMYPFIFLNALGAVGRVDFKHERAPVPAILAKVDRTAIPPELGEDLMALAFRTVEHGKQLYVHPLQKLVQ
jgi:hypothetical protein